MARPHNGHENSSSHRTIKTIQNLLKQIIPFSKKRENITFQQNEKN